MDLQEDKNKQNATQDQIKSLQEEIKTAFKADDFDAVKAMYDKIISLDPENRLAKKLMQKVDKAKEKGERKAKEQKAKEYIQMLKQLYKDEDTEKLTALAKEFKESDPENRDALKWEERAAKLREERAAKVEEKKPEPIQIEPKKEGAPMAVKPMPQPPTPAPTPVPAPTAPKPVPMAAPAPTPKPAPKEAPKEARGNLFTKMFNKKEEEIQKKSIIDTIVAKTDKKEEVKKVEEAPKKQAPKLEELKPAEEGGKAVKLLTFSKIFLNFVGIFIIFSALFLYVEWIDQDNTVLGLAGISENTGSRLRNAANTLTDRQEEEKDLNEDIELYKEGYNDQALLTVEKIIDQRINWPDIFAKIKEVTNSVYELNDFFKYIEYNNYSFDAGRGSISVSGSLSDPLGRNLTKLVELEEAFKYYPKDKNNPEDTTKPYFSGFKEFTSFSKTLDPETNRYNSTFQLSFLINE